MWSTELHSEDLSRTFLKVSVQNWDSKSQLWKLSKKQLKPSLWVSSRTLTYAQSMGGEWPSWRRTWTSQEESEEIDMLIILIEPPENISGSCMNKLGTAIMAWIKTRLIKSNGTTKTESELGSSFDELSKWNMDSQNQNDREAVSNGLERAMLARSKPCLNLCLALYYQKRLYNVNSHF